MSISVLLPTRGRTETLKKSIVSLLDNIENNHNVEFILGLDKDDFSTIKWIEKILSRTLQDANIDAKTVMFEPQGYENIHTYINEMASQARGDWLFIWHDDCIMQTKNWDNKILKYKDQFKLLAPKDNHNGHPYAMFPIIPKDWFILLGHVSYHNQISAWVSHIAYMLDIFERIDVEVFHDRADITDNNDDETFKNSEKVKKDKNNLESFYEPSMQRLRGNIAHKIAWFFKKTKQGDLSWWNKIQSGEQQNPFEKMVVPENAIGDPIPETGKSGKKRVPDDHIIDL